MKVCTCFLLFGIFAYTNSISRIRPKEDHRVVHLPQEYSNKVYSGDTNNLDNVDPFITRGTAVQDKNTKLVSGASKVETLTDFIQEAVHILNTYEDTAFEVFFQVLDHEIRKYHYRGCKFSELTQNSDTRSLLVRSLKSIRGKPVSFTKANINEVADMLRDELYDKNVKDLLDYINSLYKNIQLDFHIVLNEMQYYRNTKTVRAHNNLVQVIRGGVRAVLFDPYTELNTDTRRELKEKIDTFWKQFKNNPASSAEMNDIYYTDPVIKSASNSNKVSENIMNEVNNPKPYSKSDLQVKSKSKIERIISLETYNERFQDYKTEKIESNNESEEQITNYNTDEISSGQSLDSSSNSIKNSQEQHVEYNNQRYMTLYTEEISFKPMTTKKTDIIPTSANVTTKRPKANNRWTTSSTPRESDVSSDRTENIEIVRANYDSGDTKLEISDSSQDIDSSLTLESKHKPKPAENYDRPRKQDKADESRSKSTHKNVEIIRQYDAVVNVELDNSDLLKSLRMIDALVTDTNSRYDTTLYQKPNIQTETVPIKSTIRPGPMRAEVAVKAPIPTAPTKSHSKYLKRNNRFHKKQLSDFRENIAPPLPSGGKNQNQKHLSRSDNDTIRANDFNTYVIGRINAVENEIKELRKLNLFIVRSRMNDNNTNTVEARDLTDKIEALDKMKRNVRRRFIEKSLNEDHDLNNEEVNNRDEFIMNTETSFTTQVSNNISKINVVNFDLADFFTKKLSKEVNYNNVTTTTNYQF